MSKAISMIQSKRKGRPTGIHTPWKVKKNPERWKEDGTYSYHPLDPNYFNKYWKEHFAKPYLCEKCGAMLKCCDKIKRHEMTKKCQEARRMTDIRGENNI